MRNKLVIMLLILGMGPLSACSTKSGTETRFNTLMKDTLLLGDLLTFVTSHIPDEDVQYQTKRDFMAFDFSSFKPIDGPLNEDYISVFYNDDGEISKIKSASGSELLRYEYDVVHNTPGGYKVIFAYKFSEGEKAWINGFILIYDGNCYFFGEDKFHHTIFLESTSRISTIMLLDKNLKATQTLKFSAGKCSYRTEIVYRDASYLYSEKFWKASFNWTLDSSTSMEIVKEKLASSTSDFAYWKEQRIGVVEELANFPLWRFGGNHDHMPN